MISGEIRVCFWVKRKKEDDRIGPTICIGDLGQL